MRKRYFQKISVIRIDPVSIPEVVKKTRARMFTTSPVEAADLLSFLVLETSYCTKDQFKAFKSLQAYNQMVSGFITSAQGHIIANKICRCSKAKGKTHSEDE